MKVCALAAVAAISAGVVPADLNAQEEAGTLDIDGAEIFYRSLGSGPPVIVLHGGPSIGHGYLLSGLVPLASDHRVIFFDQRGIGLSTGAADSTRLTVSRFLDDIEAVRSALVGDEEPVHLVGHSWGAALALSYAIDRPEFVRSLTLIDPTEPGNTFQSRQEENLAAATTPADSTELAALFGSDGYRFGDPVVVEEILHVIYRSWLGARDAASRFVFGLDLEMAVRGRDVGARVARASAGLARWPDLERLGARTLIVHGVLDPVPIEMARRLATEIDGSTLVELEGVGHFPMVEAPERLLEAIREFLRGAVTDPG